jgi:hypothetical protein
MSDDIQQDQIDRFGVVDDPLSILRRLENANLSLSEMLVETLHAVRTHLGMDVAFISEFRGESRIFRYLDGNFVPLQLEVGAGDPLDESYCQRVLDGRLPELIQDAASLPEAQAMPATKAWPVGAHLSVPLRFSDGRLYGTFCCFSTTPDKSLDERDLKTLRLFADFAGRLLERPIPWCINPSCTWWKTASLATRRWLDSARSHSERRTSGSPRPGWSVCSRSWRWP